MKALSASQQPDGRAKVETAVVVAVQPRHGNELGDDRCGVGRASRGTASELSLDVERLFHYRQVLEYA